MEMQQIIEMKADETRMVAEMDANQAKAAKQQEMQAEISARMTINLKEMETEKKRPIRFKGNDGRN
jgi:hypothetical protein